MPPNQKYIYGKEKTKPKTKKKGNTKNKNQFKIMEMHLGDQKDEGAQGRHKQTEETKKNIRAHGFQNKVDFQKALNKDHGDLKRIL